ncbi:histidine kinase [Patulibacter sp. NPDC049589]|uniref:sensor histidine kinase n=1 Tax=Patulibacter sp. NPDC049589 TaxID=3154731 RepID=UPI0034413144
MDPTPTTGPSDAAPDLVPADGPRQPPAGPSGPAPATPVPDPVPRIVRLAERDLLPPGTRIERTSRDWVVDGLVFLAAALIGVLTYSDAFPGGIAPSPLAAVDLAVGTASLLALWVRRRWPVAAALAVAAASSVSAVAAGPAAVLLFTVAVHRPWRVLTPVVVLNVVSAAIFARVHPDHELAYGWNLMLVLVACAAIVGWGMFVRSRRQLILSLRDRARRAESEQQLQVAQARDHERARIAREMHDVLAHRISLLSMHAGALEFRPDASPEEVARAAGVIRTNAHLALEDLREVIGVLRGDDHLAAEPTSTTRPQPTLGDVPALLAESRAAGMRIRDDVHVDPGTPLPAGTGRNVYRVVQEGLTNARKHASGALVDVVVSGTPPEGVTVEIRNPAPVGRADGAARAGDGIPGSGTGIVGLGERTALAGGRLEHGPTADGGFRLRAWLPWPR